MKHSKEAHLLSGAYVLNALSAAENEEMETEMRFSEDLRSEVAELTDTAVLLGLSTQPVAPSSDVRARLLALVEVTPQLEPLPATAQTESFEMAPTGTVTRGPSAWFRRPAAFLAVAAAALLIFGGGAMAVVDHLMVPSESQSAAAQFAALTSSPDVKQAQAPVASGGTATVYSSKLQNMSAVVMSGVSAAPAGKVMQLWFVGKSAPESAGLYTPVDGHSYVMMTGAIKDGEGVAITVEPAGGSKSPTGSILATVSKV